MPLRWYRINSYANYIETIIEHEPENKLLEARALSKETAENPHLNMKYRWWMNADDEFV